MNKRRAWWLITLAAAAIAALAVVPAQLSAQNQSDEATRVRELAERILTTGPTGFGWAGWGVDIAASGPRPVARLLPGRLPDGLPVAVPVPPGGQLVGSVAWMADGQLASAEILIDAPGTVAQLRPIYEAAFPDQGWAPPGGLASAGLQPSRNLLRYMHCAGDEWGGLATITFGQLDAGRSEIRLYLALPAPADSAIMTAPSGPSPCPTIAGSGAVSNFRRDLLPMLRPPIGSRLESTGGAMGPNYATSEATVETRLSAGEVEAALGRQLERQGWVRLDSGDAGSVAFSRWALPHEPDWFGMLAIMATPVENRYALTVRVETPGPGAGASPEEEQE